MPVVTSIDVGIRNLGCCTYDSTEHKIRDWRLIDIGRITEPCTRLFEVLRAIAFGPCDAVVIERQPGRNKGMLRMEAYLHMYFVARGIAPKVVLYHAGNKLSGTGMENHGRARNQYAARKKASVELTHEFLRDHPQEPIVHKTFETSKKKDDLADALLQAVHYCKEPSTSTKRTSVVLGNDVKPRKPTEKQAQSGKYTPANLKYILSDRKKNTIFAYVENDPVKAALSLVSGDAKVIRAMERLYGSPEACVRALLVPAEAQDAASDVTDADETCCRIGIGCGHGQERNQDTTANAANSQE